MFRKYEMPKHVPLDSMARNGVHFFETGVPIVLHKNMIATFHILLLEVVFSFCVPISIKYIINATYVL